MDLDYIRLESYLIMLNIFCLIGLPVIGMIRFHVFSRNLINNHWLFSIKSIKEFAK